MKTIDFNHAIDIIINSNDVTVTFNTPVKDNYGEIHQIVIKDCNAHLIKTLIKNDFSLFMNKEKGGLIIDKL